MSTARPWFTLAWPLAGAAAALVAMAGAHQAAGAVGYGGYGSAPARAACAFAVAIGLAVASLLRGPAAARAAPAAAFTLAALHGLAQGALSIHLPALWRSIAPGAEGPDLLRFMADAFPAAVLSAPPLLLVATAAAVGGRDKAAWRIGLALLGGAGAILFGSPGDPAAVESRAMAGSILLLALAPVVASAGRARRTIGSGGAPSIEAPPLSADAGVPDLDWRWRMILAGVSILAGAASAGMIAAILRLATIVAGAGSHLGILFGATLCAVGGVGVLASPRALRRAGSGFQVLGTCAGAAGIMGLLSVASAGLLPFAYLDILARAGRSAAGEWAATSAVVALCLMGPALFTGAGAGAAASMRRSALPLAFGSIGAAAGLALAPSAFARFGVQGSLILAGAALALTGAVVVLFESGPIIPRAARSAALLAFTVLVLLRAEPWDDRLLAAGVGARPDLYIEAARATLADRAARDRVLLRVDGKVRSAALRLLEGRLQVLSLDGAIEPLDGLESLRAQSMAGHLPALLGGGSGRALVLGAGAGATIEAIASHGSFEITAAPGDHVALEVALAARAILGRDSPASAPATPRVIEADARRALVAPGDRFDLIASPPPLGEEDLALIFSDRTLDLIVDRLAPGGIVAFPVPLHRLSREGVESAIAIFRKRFPRGSGWIAGPSLILIGGAEPEAEDPSRLGRRARGGAGVEESLTAVGFDDPLKILASRILDLSEKPPAPRRDPPSAIRAGAASARMRPPLAENLAWFASKVTFAARPPVFPAAWSEEAKMAALARIAVLRETQRWSLIAESALAAGRDAEALEAAERALLHDPSDLEARYLAARSLSLRAERALSRGDSASAASDCEKAISLDPGSVEALTLLAWIWHGVGYRDEAESLLRRGVAAAPWVWILHYRLGLVRLEVSDLDGAESELRRAYDLDPRQPETLLLLGDIARKRGQFDHAADLYRRSLSLGGRAAEIRTALAALHLEASRPDEAAAEIEKALSAKPGDPEALLTRARIRQARGDRDGARIDLLAAVTTGGPSYRARAMAEASLRALLMEGAGGAGER